MISYDHTSYLEFQKHASGKQIICFGAGKYAEQALQDPSIVIDVSAVRCFTDNDKSKHGKTMTVSGREIEILPPECLRSSDKQNTVVLITAQRHTGMEKQIEALADGEIRWFSLSKMWAGKQLSAEFSEKSGTRFILMYSPDYPNLGDHAIAMAERKFLKDNFSNPVIEVSSTICLVGMELLPEYISEKDIIFITGGGYMGTIWPVAENVIRDTVRMFPKNPVIVFPQSIYYGNTPEDLEELERSKKVYNSHGNLLLCAREEISYEFMKKEYPSCASYLMPDMVLSLNTEESGGKREGIAFCLRNDIECALNESGKQNIYNAAQKHRLTIFEIENFISFESGITHKSGEKFVKDKLNEYQRAELVITDRLHGLVFSAITATPCLVLDNSYHKNRALFKWLENYGYLDYCSDASDIPQISEKIGELLRAEGRVYTSTSFSSYFHGLADFIIKTEGVYGR